MTSNLPSARPITRPETLVSLADAVGERSVGAEAAARFLADTDVVAIGGFLGGEPAGYLIGYLVTRVDGDPMLLVYDVSVAGPMRRRGIGRAMVEAALRIAVEARAAKAWVVTRWSDEPAMSLYRSTGAVPSGDDDIVMSWPQA